MDRNQLINLAFTRIAQVGWEVFALKDLQEMGASVHEISRAFADKSDLLDAFAHMMNASLEATAFTFMEEDTPLDRLFEVTMARLDLLAPYKQACASIFASFETSPLEGAVFTQTLRGGASLMVDLAGIAAPPLLFTSAFGVFYGVLLTSWARDQDPHLEETMAFCHKGLGKLCDFFKPCLAA